MPSPPSYGCCTRVNFVLKRHLLFQMNLSNSGLKNRSIKEYWLIFTILKFPLGLQFSHNLTKFKIIKYISAIYIMTTTCTYLQQLTQVSDVAHGPLVQRRAVVSYWRKYVHEVLDNHLGCLSLPRKSVVRLTDRPAMTLDVYRGRKTTMQQQGHLTRKSEVLGSIPGLATYFRFSFH